MQLKYPVHGAQLGRLDQPRMRHGDGMAFEFEQFAERAGIVLIIIDDQNAQTPGHHEASIKEFGAGHQAVTHIPGPSARRLDSSPPPNS